MCRAMWLRSSCQRGRNKRGGYFVFVFILNMKGFNVITASFWLKENGMSVPNGTWRIYGMVLKPRS